MYIKRLSEKQIRYSLRHFPVTAIVGPRQCGKSTLARKIAEGRKSVVYLDLERPDDLTRLADPLLFLSSAKGSLVCIDEVQRKPELFPVMRSLIDEWDRPGSFLLLGSASRDLLRQSSESLAGRISYQTLTPFLPAELMNLRNYSLARYMERGGFPRSFLARENKASYMWRDDFVTTFLERDLIFWKSFTPETMRRMWRMLAHMNGQTVNYSSIASSLDITSATVKTYIDLLESTYMVDVIKPWYSNMKKRLVKAPKVYISDSGITMCLLRIERYRDALAHPAFGSIWEQIVLQVVRGACPDAEMFFYRTASGSEMDFVIDTGAALYAVECKASTAPTLTKGNFNAMADIKADKVLVACPVDSGWPMADGVTAVSLRELAALIQTSP
jgi:predicted AAA+ superfamily ATPase